jgi:putative FmdB family regulatory protein
VKALPLYPYRCTQCGYRFEKIQSFSSPPEVECPECKGALERLLTVPGLQFKGTGWYVNDYVSRDSTVAKDPHESESKPAAADNSTAAVASEAKTKAPEKASDSKESSSKKSSAAG